MPMRIRPGCSAPGCPRISTDRGRCSEHARPDRQRRERLADADRWRGSAASRGYDWRWQRLRLLVLAAEPICRRCSARGEVVEATLVDHILPLSEGGGFEEDNLQPLCVGCHAQKTQEDKVRYGSKN